MERKQSLHEEFANSISHGFGILFSYTHRFKKVSLILYLGMGWMAIFFIKPLLENLSITVLALIAGGSLSYTLGTLFYTRPHQRFAHTIWHIFVLAGTVIHFVAILFMLTEI